MKQHITITIDAEVIADLKLRNIKISQTVNDYLRAYLDLPTEDFKKSVSQLKQEFDQYQAHAIKVKTLLDAKVKQQAVEDSKWTTI